MTQNEIKPSALDKASTRPFAGKIARSMLVLILLLLIFFAVNALATKRARIWASGCLYPFRATTAYWGAR